MKAMLFSLLLALPLAVAAEEETKDAKEKAAAAKKEIFIKIEEKIRPVLEGLEPVPQFEYVSQSSLQVSYKAQIFKVHGRLKTGEISKETRDEFGPAHTGFVLNIHLESKGAVHAAVTPQNIREPYWTMFLELTPIADSNMQTYWNFCYGVRTDKTILSKVKQAMGELAK